MANVLDKLSKRLRPRAKRALREIMYAATKADVETANPKAIACLLVDQAALLVFSAWTKTNVPRLASRASGSLCSDRHIRPPLTPTGNASIPSHPDGADDALFNPSRTSSKCRSRVLARPRRRGAGAVLSPVVRRALRRTKVRRWGSDIEICLDALYVDLTGKSTSRRVPSGNTASHSSRE